VHVRTMKKWFRRGLKAIAEWCQENRHMPVEEQQKTLNARLRGHHQYYGRATNYRSIWQFFREVRQIWRRWLSRRTRGNRMTWEKCHLRWAVQYWRGVPSAPIIRFRATGRLVVSRSATGGYTIRERGNWRRALSLPVILHLSTDTRQRVDYGDAVAPFRKPIMWWA